MAPVWISKTPIVRSLRSAGLAILVGLSSNSAIAQTSPWVAYGQSKVTYNEPLDNPGPNAAGALGEVKSFPYTVPTSKVLYLQGWGIEAYPNQPGGVAIFPWLGTPPIENAKCLHTTYCDNQTCQTSAVYALPAG